VDTAQIRTLKGLCEADGVSGNEGAVRRLVVEAVRPYAEVRIDALGNVIAHVPPRQPDGALPAMKVMLAAHMDEIGFMLTSADGPGQFRFETVGGLDPRQLVGKTVRVGAAGLTGVIGAAPIHLTTPEERRSPVALASLRIDVGPQTGAAVGDYAAFRTAFAEWGPSLSAKALDDRVGVATLIEVVRQAPPQLDLWAVFTVQEEIGGRGALVAAQAIRPDLAFVLDCTPALDLPKEDGENVRCNARLDAGVAIYTADRGTLSDPRLVAHLEACAAAYAIPWQRRQPGGGATDAAAIHQAAGGIPSISLSTPGRYMHTASSLIRRADWQSQLQLILAALHDLTPAILADPR
jgi:endoglucanase